MAFTRPFILLWISFICFNQLDGFMLFFSRIVTLYKLDASSYRIISNSLVFFVVSPYVSSCTKIDFWGHSTLPDHSSWAIWLGLSYLTFLASLSLLDFNSMARSCVDYPGLPVWLDYCHALANSGLEDLNFVLALQCDTLVELKSWFNSWSLIKYLLHTLHCVSHAEYLISRCFINSNSELNFLKQRL